MASSRNIIAIVLAAAITFLTIRVYHLESEQRLLKEDLIELSNIKYGLFSIDEWKQILARIITKKINELDLKGANREKMRKEISGFLYKAIDDFEDQYHEKQSGSFVGFLRGTGARFFKVFDEMKDYIPTITENILDFMNDPKNRKAVRGYILTKLDDYTDKTFGKIDYTIHDEIIARHQVQDREQALALLSGKIDSIQKRNQPYKASLLVLALLSGLYLIFNKRFLKDEYMVLTMICMVLLLSGLLLPMIEIDARISTMNFTLLGELVTFKDQVLYYKSKSILEVVQLMITQSKVDLLLVGLLVFVFSVLFPVSKLASSIMYVYSRRLRSNKVVRFLILKTGKWSMADVMVIAIFMAYIGFTGIITEQLKQIEKITPTLDLLTTNNSNLRTGFFLFTAFAILSLLVSHKLQYEFRQPRMTEDRKKELERFLS